MKYINKLALIILLVISFGCAHTHKLSEFDQIKSDLIGQTTGGREKTWKFQSLGQIKDFKIESKETINTMRVYVVLMTLHDERVKTSYRARVKIIYKREEIKSVGLLDIKQI